MSSLLLVVIVVVVFPATFDFLIFYVSSFYQTFLKIVFPLAIALFVFSVEASIECFKCFLINGKTTSTANGVCLFFSVEAGIGCFKCFSINGSEPACGDPFHPAKGDYYKQFCRQTRTDRVGEFPAKYCTKIMGVNCQCPTTLETLLRLMLHLN